MAKNNKQLKAKPFLKWAGGKTQLLKTIADKIPFKKCDTFNYIEPFVGSGAVLFWILNEYPNIKSAVINDVNTDLINCYCTIRDEVPELIKELVQYDKEYNSLAFNSAERSDYYYLKRNIFNQRSENQVKQTALFIFLNRTCFNGLYRVNSNNQFNVPQGRYKKPQICNYENLHAVSEILKKVKILNTDFSETLTYAQDSSFFYFDPPYKPLSDTSNFNSYAKDNFNDEEQVRLKLFCDKIDSRGSKWILSNSDVKGTDKQNDFFDDLYADYRINRVSARRAINSSADKRGALSELLITNFTD